MKNKIFTMGLFLAVVLLSGQGIHAQNAFNKGDVVINAGIGLGNTFSFGGLGLPLGAGVEYGVTDDIGVSLDGGFVSGTGITATYIGARGSYHLNRVLELNGDEFDFYAGLGLYYRSFSIDGIGFTLSSGAVAAFHAGGRYYFSDNFGVQAELGNSYGWMKLGVVYKL